MSTNYLDGFLAMLKTLGDVVFVGLVTASAEGAGWSSLESASGA